MATLTPTRPAPQSYDGGLLLPGTSWADYEAMLRIVGDRHVRVTYDGDAMEVSVPSQKHEQLAQWLGLFVSRLAEELQIPYEPLGMTTWKKASSARGLEPDQCYYFAHEAIVREKSVIDLEVDPPPDLAIEVDITHSSLDRLAIYAILGVPEVWRHDGRSLVMLGLGPDGRYTPLESSVSLPRLRPSDVEQFLELGRTLDKLHWARELRQWASVELLGRRGEGDDHG